MLRLVIWHKYPHGNKIQMKRLMTNFLLTLLIFLSSANIFAGSNEATHFFSAQNKNIQYTVSKALNKLLLIFIFTIHFHVFNLIIN